MPKIKFLLIISALLTFSIGFAQTGLTKEIYGFGIHGMIGTDVQLGLGIGGGVSYVLPGAVAAFEIGPDLIVHSWSESGTTDTGWLYEESLDLQILAIRFNSLFNYDLKNPGVFFIVGTGFVSATMDYDYKERYSVNDTWILGGTSGDAGGMILNFGVGTLLKGNIEFRLEVPVLLFFSTYGNASAVAPTITAGAGVRF